MQRLVYTPEEEQLLMSQLWSPQIADNPETFVLFAFPWGQEGTPLAKFKGPRKWQRKILRQIAEHVKAGRMDKAWRVFKKAVCSGRGIGKSALLAWIVIWFLTTRIGASVIVSANSEPQLRTITWPELDKWVTMSLNAHWWEVVGIKLTPAKWLAELVERDLKKSTKHWGAEGKLWSEDKPDSYAGAHNHDGMMVIFDEASGIPDAIWSVAAGFFTEETPDRYWFTFSNGRRDEGYFFECFNAKREFWNNENINALDVEGTDRGVYEEIIAEHGPDSDEARVEVYGLFPKGGGDEKLIPLPLINDAVKRPPVKDATAPVVIGIDPSRGGDCTVIAVRQGRDLTHILRYPHVEDTMKIVGFIIEAIEEHQPQLAVIDQGGMGGPLLDRLHELGYKKIVKGVDFGWSAKNPRRWGNKRAEMWGDLREWLKTASIPDDRGLKTDLNAPKKEPDSAGVVYLESKKKMKARGVASPDAADAVAVTFAFPVANPDGIVVKKAVKQKSVQMSDDWAGSWMGV